MSNILAQGAGGMVSGAVGGFFAAGPIGATVGAFVGGTFGLGLGLTTGAIMQSTGTYNYIEQTTNRLYRREEY